MVDKVSFTVKFTFEDKDTDAILKLHKALSKLGVASNIVKNNGNDAVPREDRCRGILNCMKPKETYSTGRLWRLYPTSTGHKTFQRDLAYLVLSGKISGEKSRAHGSTTLWSRRD